MCSGPATFNINTAEREKGEVRRFESVPKTKTLTPAPCLLRVNPADTTTFAALPLTRPAGVIAHCFSRRGGERSQNK